MSQVMPMEDRAVKLLREHGEQLTVWFGGLRGRHPDAPGRLLDAVEYSLLAGGKRLRPALVLECALAVNPKAARNASVNASVLAAAAAIELIHTFSLVHDDLPAMDDDDLRRGRADQPQGIRRSDGDPRRRCDGDDGVRNHRARRRPSARAGAGARIGCSERP